MGQINDLNDLLITSANDPLADFLSSLAAGALAPGLLTALTLVNQAIRIAAMLLILYRGAASVLKTAGTGDIDGQKDANVTIALLVRYLVVAALLLPALPSGLNPFEYFVIQSGKYSVNFAGYAWNQVKGATFTTTSSAGQPVRTSQTDALVGSILPSLVQSGYCAAAAEYVADQVELDKFMADNSAAVISALSAGSGRRVHILTSSSRGTITITLNGNYSDAGPGLCGSISLKDPAAVSDATQNSVLQAHLAGVNALLQAAIAAGANSVAAGEMLRPADIQSLASPVATAAQAYSAALAAAAATSTAASPVPATGGAYWSLAGGDLYKISVTAAAAQAALAEAPSSTPPLWSALAASEQVYPRQIQWQSWPGEATRIVVATGFAPGIIAGSQTGVPQIPTSAAGSFASWVVDGFLGDLKSTIEQADQDGQSPLVTIPQVGGQLLTSGLAVLAESSGLAAVGGLTSGIPILGALTGGLSSLGKTGISTAYGMVIAGFLLEYGLPIIVAGAWAAGVVVPWLDSFGQLMFGGIFRLGRSLTESDEQAAASDRKTVEAALAVIVRPVVSIVALAFVGAILPLTCHIALLSVMASTVAGGQAGTIGGTVAATLGETFLFVAAAWKMVSTVNAITNAAVALAAGRE